MFEALASDGFESVLTFSLLPMSPSFKQFFRCISPLLFSWLLLIADARAATITRQPENLTVVVGQRAALSVQATSPGKLSYQWRRNGLDIPGSRGASYVLPAADRCDADWYEVVVLDGLENVVSKTVRLSVAPTSYPGKIAIADARTLAVERDTAGVSLVTAVASDGKFYVAGDLSSAGGIVRSGIVRFLPDGTLDDTFAVESDRLIVKAILPMSDGGVLIAGNLTWQRATGTTFLSKLREDGTLVEEIPVKIEGTGTALARQADGRILVGGTFLRVNGVRCPGICRLNADLTIDPTLNVAFEDDDILVNAILPQTDGKIVLGGQFKSIAGVSKSNLARVDRRGALDLEFTTTADSAVTCLSADSSGRIVVGGHFYSIGGQVRQSLARLLPDGSIDGRFPSMAIAGVEAIAMTPQGGFYIGGQFPNIDWSTNNQYVARIEEDGTTASDFNPRPSGTVTSIALLPDAKILLGGMFGEMAGTKVSSLAMVDHKGVLKREFAPDLRFLGRINSLLELPGGRLFAAGLFTHLGGRAAQTANMAVLLENGEFDASFVPSGGADGEIMVALRQADGKCYCSGAF